MINDNQKDLAVRALLMQGCMDKIKQEVDEFLAYSRLDINDDRFGQIIVLQNRLLEGMQKELD